jgi:hypothetical protein
MTIRCDLTTPQGTGQVDIIVIVNGLTSLANPNDVFTYEALRHRQLESAMRARNTPLGFSSAQIATLVLEMSRQTVKARSRVVRRSSAVAFSG